MTSKAEKVISASVSRFTPCPDTLVEQYSHTTALVWGKVWRYSQMADGVCRASILRLADDLSLVPNTISKHLSLLEEGKYIVDKTPNLRNKPHIYADTGKLQLRVSITMDEPEAGTQNLSSHYSNFEVEESTTKGREAQSIFTAYEANIGAITPMIAEKLREAELEYSPVWVVEAIQLAVLNNKRNWRYCETILKRWQDSGKDEGKGKPAPTRADALQAELKKQGYDV